MDVGLLSLGDVVTDPTKADEMLAESLPLIRSQAWPPEDDLVETGVVSSPRTARGR